MPTIHEKLCIQISLSFLLKDSQLSQNRAESCGEHCGVMESMLYIVIYQFRNLIEIFQFTMKRFSFNDLTVC